MNNKNLAIDYKTRSFSHQTYGKTMSQDFEIIFLILITANSFIIQILN